MRIAVIERERCINGKGCSFLCGKLCPVNRQGKECIKLDEKNKPVIDESLCIGCGICTKRCPTQCIHIVNLPEQLKEKPIHRYGINGFELFSLPIPIFNSIVGIIGRNGIGKSTALQIIAGLLKPNLGIQGKEATFDELIQHFKGTEAQTFFENLKEGKIKSSFKPQQVDLIPAIEKGKVKDLLKKIDTSNRLTEIAKELDIEKLLESDIKHLSGGELQRIAIAAAFLKDANLIILDEPTSFLDIKQRLKTARFIRKECSAEKSIILVEHDLIVLDYLADYIHIAYGKPSVFGVISMLKSARAGINTYLEGYLKEENIRFRDYPIQFQERAPPKQEPTAILTKWTELEFAYERFNLTATEGCIYRNDVIGVLGENGIGKTTFIKLLAGELKPVKGEIEKNITISYKPQFLREFAEQNKDVTVKDILKEAITKYKHQLIAPLELEKLYDRKLSELSGGELQRVAIAKCLAKKADLYLLDEPSAYLDIEQRLALAKIINEILFHANASAIIVDHDLLFIDSIAKRILVFQGIPAEHGIAKGPFDMETGMNLFLKDIGITFRRDPETKRPRANKPGSVKDREQKELGKYYYS